MEDDVPILGAIAAPAERGEREGVGSVVGEIEAALLGERGEVWICEPHAAGADEPVEFLLVTRLAIQAADGRQTLPRGCVAQRGRN